MTLWGPVREIVGYLVIEINDLKIDSKNLIYLFLVFCVGLYFDLLQITLNEPLCWNSTLFFAILFMNELYNLTNAVIGKLGKLVHKKNDSHDFFIFFFINDSIIIVQS
jgi:hypothetical protein